MRKTMVAIATSVLVIGLLVAVPAEASGEGFPGMGEIFSTVELPDYTLDTFIHDLQTVFSEGMFNDSVRYISDMFTFLTADTFLDSSYNGEFTDSYVNIYLVVCIILIALCILGAVVSFLRYRHYDPSTDD